MTRPSAVRQRTRSWVEGFVVGLNLCPFAKPILPALRIEVFEGDDLEALTATLTQTLERFAGEDEHAAPTAILVTPDALHDFYDYNDFLAIADDIIRSLELEGIIQIASFHPEYRFANTPADDPSNYSNRSPYPMFHLLREAHIDEAVERHPDTLQIPDNNVALLRKMGLQDVRALSQKCSSPDDGV